MRQRCVLSMQEMRNLSPEFPLFATAERWKELGRSITDDAERRTVGVTVFFPKWATAPYSTLPSGGV